MKMWRYFILTGSCLLLATSCGKSSKTDAMTPQVSIVVVDHQDSPVDFTYIAQIQSSHLVNIQARVSGFLDRRVYTEGDLVKKGDVLFIMDKRPFEAEVAAAQAALERQQAAHETARLNLERVKPLSERNALSQKDLDDAIGEADTTAAAVNEAEARLETALLNLSYCTIASPLDGITGAALQQEGSYLNIADSKLTTVSALDPIWVNFSVSENQIQNYRDQVERGLLVPPKNQEFVVSIIQVNGKEFPHKGTITFTAPFFNPATGTFLIRATLDNPEGLLRPNQYVRARVSGAMRPDAILVPQRAVQQSAKGPYVWVITEEDKADLRPVVLGDWQGANWFINEGLENGERVVTDGMLKLRPGIAVNVKDET